LKPSGIENIIFDLGNTLCFYDFCYFYDGVARLEKHLDARKFKSFIRRKKLGEAVSKGRIHHKDLFKKLKRKFNLRISYSDFTYLYCDIFWENSTMKNFLEQINSKKKYKLFLLSNTCSQHIRFIYKNFPYVNLIKNKILSFKVHMLKPDNKIFKYVLNKYQLDPEKTILIDDILENIKSAKSCGMQGIHYINHKNFLREFRKLTN
jgi:putative hydrolase of the HAD superfamily